MKVESDKQTSLTDDLYEKDIEIANFHAELAAIERRIHFVRTTISAARMQFQDVTRMNSLYNSLGELKKELTSMIDWTSDLLFYISDASEDIESKSLGSYKKLRDADNTVERDDRIDLKQIAGEILKVRQDLLELSGRYWGYVVDNKPCETVYEILIEAAREAVRKSNKIELYNHV